MYGTYVNTAVVIAGSLVGIIFRERFPDKVKKIVFQGVGLVTLFIGIQTAFKTSNLVILFLSILIGAVVGEVIDIEKHLENVGDRVKTRFGSEDNRFVEGLLTAFLVFCVGSMTILGSIEDGLNNNPSILYAKSILDGFTSISFASIFGLGVLFSAIPLFIFQGSITLLSSYSQAFFTNSIINELSGAGGILLIGLGINMLEIRKIKVLNLLPSLIVAVILAYLVPIIFP